ncbi:MAG: ferritin family protein [Nitrospinota bacterium]
MESLLADLEILKLAMATELEGRNLYRRLAERATHPEAHRLLQDMADEEPIHLNVIEELYRKLRSQRYGLEADFPIFKGLPEEKSGIRAMPTLEEILRVAGEPADEASAFRAAILIERRALETYQDLLPRAQDSQAAELLRWLIQEETQHRGDLERQRDERGVER